MSPPGNYNLSILKLIFDNFTFLCYIYVITKRFTIYYRRCSCLLISAVRNRAHRCMSVTQGKHHCEEVTFA